MGLRESLNQSPGLAKWIAGGLCAVAATALAYSLLPGHRNVAASRADVKANFTTDISSEAAALAAMFADDATKLPVFDHGQKPAYRLIAFKDPAAGKVKIAYVERWTEAGKARFEQMRRKLSERHEEIIDSPAGREVAVPGATITWFPNGTLPAESIQSRLPASAQEIVP